MMVEKKEAILDKVKFNERQLNYDFWATDKKGHKYFGSEPHSYNLMKTLKTGDIVILQRHEYGYSDSMVVSFSIERLAI